MLVLFLSVCVCPCVCVSVCLNVSVFPCASLHDKYLHIFIAKAKVGKAIIIKMKEYKRKKIYNVGNIFPYLQITVFHYLALCQICEKPV